MKNRLFIVFVICCFFSVLNVNASTNTQERTTDNLLIPEYIEVTDNNLDDILLTPAIDASEKIYDFADLFSDSEESILFDKVSSYISDTNMDMVVVTIENNNKSDAQTYADDFYDYNSFGVGSNHDGLLFLIDMDNREIYITTTGSAIDVYPSSAYNRILDYVYTYMSNREYYEGTKYFVDLATSYAHIDSSNVSRYTINSSGELVRNNGPIFAVLIFAFIGTAVIMFIMVRMNKMVFKAASSREYLKKDTKAMEVVRDTFLGSHVAKIKISDDNASGGGIHNGGSGIGHGGGGHKF